MANENSTNEKTATSSLKVFTSFFDMKSKDEVRKGYDEIADKLDELSKATGYTGHSRITSKLSEVEPKKDARILDLGCGTGQVGEKLLEEGGYTNVYGVDLSLECLKVAKGKGCYAELIQADLSPGSLSDFPDGFFDAAVSAGSFMPMHLNESHLPLIVRLLKTGGHIVITTRKYLFEEEVGDLKLKTGLRDMVKTGLLEKVSHEDYVYTKDVDLTAIMLCYKNTTLRE